MCNHVYDEREKVNEKKYQEIPTSLAFKIKCEKKYDEDEISVEIESENINEKSIASRSRLYAVMVLT